MASLFAVGHLSKIESDAMTQSHLLKDCARNQRKLPVLFPSAVAGTPCQSVRAVASLFRNGQLDRCASIHLQAGNSRGCLASSRFTNHCSLGNQGRGGGVPRGLGVGVGLGGTVTVAVGVAVAVAVAVAVGVGVGVRVAVGVAVGVGVGVRVAVAVAVAVGVGVGVRVAVAVAVTVAVAVAVAVGV